MHTSARIGSYSGPAKLGDGHVMVELTAHCELGVSGTFEEVKWDGVAYILNGDDLYEIIGSHVPIEIEGRTAEMAAAGDFLLMEGIHEIRLIGRGAPPFEIAVV